MELCCFIYYLNIRCIKPITIALFNFKNYNSLYKAVISELTGRKLIKWAQLYRK